MRMSFAWPHLLWLLLLPAALAAREVTRRVRTPGTSLPKVLRAEAAPGQMTLSTGARQPGAPRTRWRLWLGLALVTVALARPQWGRIEEQVFDQAREILIAMDLSRSMLAPDVPPSRLDRAKLLTTSLLEQLDGERIGLVIFAGTAFLQAPLSADYEILRGFLADLGPDFLPQGGSNFDAMLQTSLDAFGPAGSADRFLIVLSDGEAHTDAWQKRVTALRERNVTVISLGIGTADGAMLPDGRGGFVKDDRGAVVLSRLNPATLEELARRTGGVYHDASRWVDLGAVLRQTVEAGRQGEFVEVRQQRLVERFQWALAPALFLLLWSYWREFPVHPRPRAVSLAPREREPAPARRQPRAVAAVAALLLGISLAPTPSAAADDQNPFAAPLTQVVGRLAAQLEPSAADYAEMARATITYGERMIASGDTPESGAVADALEAVKAGAAQDPGAADWNDLRRQLEALQPPEPPEEQPQQPQEPQEQQKNDSDQDDRKQDQKSSAEEQPEQDSSAKQDSSEQQSTPQSRDETSSDGGADERDGKEQQPSEPSSSTDDPQSAFGEMDDGRDSPPEPPHPQPAPGETQQVGGQSERRTSAEQDPALVIPMQKLDRLKQQDSPAKLYQLMQDPKARTPAEGSDW